MQSGKPGRGSSNDWTEAFLGRSIRSNIDETHYPPQQIKNYITELVNKPELVHTPEFVNRPNPSGVRNHSLGHSKVAYHRGRVYWKKRRENLCAISSAVVPVSEHKKGDPRPYTAVKIAGESITGLLDSGASISCLGRGATDFLNRHGLQYSRVHSNVNTADGTSQTVLGYLDTTIEYGNQFRLCRIYIVPSLSQSLYLGIDFWNSFGIVPATIAELEVPSIDPNQHDLTAHQKGRLDQVVNLFPSFATKGLGRTMLTTHIIDTGSASPIKQRHYPVSPAVQALIDQELDRMLSMGVIEESNSAWSSPVVVVKRANGKPRLCLDVRRVNAVTTKDAYPTPIVEGLLSRLSDTRFISAIDLKDAFWQIGLEEESREKTAFSVPGRPLYQFRVMPFGLCNAPQRLCRLMDKVIPHELRHRIFVYLDDLLVVSPDFDTHLLLLQEVATRLQSAGLTINVEKSRFCLREVHYLGYIVGNGCLKTNPDRVAAITSYPQPTTVKQLRRFLGMAGWYRRFLANFASISAPLTDLLKKTGKFVWSEQAQDSFNSLKASLSSAPILTNPNFDKQFECDACSTGVGGVLCQEDDNGDSRPIAFMSH